MVSTPEYVVVWMPDWLLGDSHDGGGTETFLVGPLFRKLPFHAADLLKLILLRYDDAVS